MTLNTGVTDGQLGQYYRRTVAIADRLGKSLSFDEVMHVLQLMHDNEIERAVEVAEAAAIVKPAPLFSVIATTQLGAIAGKKTKKCLSGPRYAYRDSDFDNWLPKVQPNTDACVITTLAPAKAWTFAESSAAILGIGIGTDIKLLGQLLINHGYTMTLPQAEEMVEKTERDEKTEMCKDGYANFFFVETGNENDPVSVGHVSRDSRDWYAYVSRLDSGRRWFAGTRLLVRNLGTLKLGL